MRLAIGTLLFYLATFRKFFDEDEVGMLLVLIYASLELMLLIAIGSTYVLNSERAKKRKRDL